jgi:hypothetical protein
MTGTIAGFTSTGIDDNATSTAITIDASENVGIGVVPTDYTNRFSLDIGLGAKIWSHKTVANDFTMANNLYYNGGFKYITTDSVQRYSMADDSHTFETAPSGTAGAAATLTTRMQILEAGDVKVNTGNLVIGTSGKGIDFSADGNAAGMTSEVLDDYEEGTWTPTLVGGTTAGSYTNYSSSGSKYTKVGRKVHVVAVMYGTSGTGTGDFRVTGLPFANANGGFCCGNVQANGSLVIPTGTITMMMYASDTVSFVVRCTKDNATHSHLAYPVTCNYIRFEATYYVS